MSDIARELGQFAVDCTFEGIPGKTREFTKGLILKTVAGMLAGAAMPVGGKIIEATRSRRHAEEVGSVGCGMMTSLWNAVLNNALFAHAAELEDDSFLRGTAWDITSIPVYFPLAEKHRLSGKELLEVCAVGLEVHSRTTLFFPQGCLGLTAVPGAVGVAAGIGRAMNLDAEGIYNAFGLALSTAPVSYLNFGTDAHYLESALQSVQALLACELAKEGMTGNPDIVGYLAKLIGEENVIGDKITEDLGRRWLVHDIWIKKYPCCFHQHRHIDALLETFRDNEISYEDVDSVKIHISPLESICDRPSPQSIGDLQFSFQHSIASAMIQKDIDYASIRNDKIKDPLYRTARGKVAVVVHEEWKQRYAMEPPAEIEITLRDGRQFQRGRQYAVGAPQEPLSMEQYKGLFRKFTQHILDDHKIEDISEALASLEQLSAADFHDLYNKLVYALDQ